MNLLCESAIEALPLERLAALGYACLHGPDIAPGEFMRSMRQVRDTLLPKLMSGEKRVEV